ncbi:M3 family metallopeptidase [Sphingobium sp.]|uniref:M3 family metallopeptidase n=1 Tax=Sphingobium sp. TaxID=1912891 RepID=UPI003BB66538
MTDIISNPLLDAQLHPRFGTIEPAHILPAVESAIADHRAAMRRCADEQGFAAVFLAKESADAALSRVWATVNHLVGVANTPELRAAHAEAQPLIDAYFAEVGQDRALYDALFALPTDDLGEAESRALSLTLQGFILSGVALDGDEREAFAANSVEQGRIATEFANAVMDATEAWTLLIEDPARLDGVPESDRDAMARAAQAQGKTGWLVDLHAPSVRAITGFAQDRDLRHAVYEAYGTRASDQGPDAGRFDNSDRIARLLALRQQSAALLGYADSVALSLSTKMARDGDEVDAFLVDLAERARPRAQQELAEIADFARDFLGIDELQPWDIAFATERMRREVHALDEAVIRAHLPLSRVLNGLFALVGELYGLEVRTSDAPVWHDDVRYFTLHQQGEDEPVAALYCDVFARSGKRGGAWMDVCRPRLREADFSQLPIAYLVCNFASGSPDRPAHVTHNEMVTLFHEMGHCLHHLLTQVDLPSVGGIAGVEWDAVELPSQFMENFAWEPNMLRRVSAHENTGAPLDDAMIGRMLAARRFMGALGLLRQVEFALFDLRLHRAAAQVDGPSVGEVLNGVRQEVAMIQPPHWHRFAHGFSHIFAGGYAAGYYSYLWAERLSADAFEAFADAKADRAVLGGQFRDHVLARGGSRPALDNFVAFRGREPDSAALLRALGLAA